MYKRQPQLQKELEEAEASGEAEEKEDTLLRDKVPEEEISRIVARWTGIPEMCIRDSRSFLPIYLLFFRKDCNIELQRKLLSGDVYKRQMLEATESLPIDVHFMLPSCVPATPLDESGCALDYKACLLYTSRCV